MTSSTTTLQRGSLPGADVLSLTPSGAEDEEGARAEDDGDVDDAGWLEVVDKDPNPQ